MIDNPQMGQRWIVDTDSSLGLGLISECNARTLMVEFPATGESRCYSRDNAPLTRVAFSKGDAIEVDSGETYIVAETEDVNGLLVYLTECHQAVPETRLSANVSLNHPVKRLLAGQLDKPQWFDLRAELVHAYHRWQCSEVVGLQGARITLTPHQLYVAHTATALASVRVLLADEVGLGKTIEAGLILQRLLLQERVARVLVLVPEALCVQWFVELVRCFNIHAVLHHEETDLDEARIFIAPHHLLVSQQASTQNPWDMLIVDEAHHFDLVNQNDDSRSHMGRALNVLARESEHVLLLSATPERMGLEQHFARLQLLDAARFYDFGDFQQQYQLYESIATELAALVAEPSALVTATTLEKLAQALPDIPRERLFEWQGKATQQLVDFLLDCHGTGRVVYRNTRNAIQGFPERKLIPHEIGVGDEASYQWLQQFIKDHADEKILLIAHQKEEVLNLREWLYRSIGLDCPVFHEGMTLIERDRAAAYFADQEDGAPLLLCSEIGSEGRNFQFCHHLICWDLPEHPDVLEQRIGRLDRIGQQHTVNIHVCITDKHSHQRLEWYHTVLDAVEQSNPAAGMLHDQWFSRYCDCESPDDIARQVRERNKVYLEQLQNGRDRLLEINSCRQPQATNLVDNINAFEQNASPQALLTTASDLLNIHFEALDATRFSVIPSDQMLIPLMPGIPAEGCEITFDRATAIAREDVQFVTWDHPLMQGLIEMITQSELGVATVALFPNKGLKVGTLFYEAVFNVVIGDALSQVANRFLSQSTIRIVLVNGSTKNLGTKLPHQYLKNTIEKAPKNIRKAVINDYHKEIQHLSENASTLADEELAQLINQSVANAKSYFEQEEKRLLQLQYYNASISDDTLNQHQQRSRKVMTAIKENARLELNAVRLLVSCKPEVIRG